MNPQHQVFGVDRDRWTDGFQGSFSWHQQERMKEMEEQGRKMTIVSLLMIMVVAAFVVSVFLRMLFRMIWDLPWRRWNRNRNQSRNRPSTTTGLGYYERVQTDDVNDGHDHIPMLPITTAHDVVILDSHVGNGNGFYSGFGIGTSMQNIIQNGVVQPDDILKITVNGIVHEIESPGDMLLSTFLREKLGLRGTKLGCEEGGCGACTVVLQVDQSSLPVSVNACLRLVVSCDGASITTVEGIGSISGGLSTEQQQMVQCSATQCGYCSPGWVNAMYALNHSGKAMSALEIQQALDGNICRCTGYRPILKAFESFAKTKCTGDCNTCKGCDGNNHNSQSNSFDIENCAPHKHNDQNRKSSHIVRFKSRGKSFIKPTSMMQLLDVLKWEIFTDSIPTVKSYQILGGNTSIGVTKYYNQTAPYNTGDSADLYIDITKIPELSTVLFDSSSRVLTIGAAVTISSLIEALTHYSTGHNSEGNDTDAALHHDAFLAAANHLGKVANTQVRNAGTWAGNLMINMKYKNFPSDVIIALSTTRATLCTINANGNISMMSMQDFLSVDYDNFVQNKCVFTHVMLYNTIGSDFFVETFKVAQRGRNAHAYVNASICLQLNHKKVCEDAQIVVGGVANSTFFASNVQNVLQNSQFTQNTLDLAFVALDEDILLADMKVNNVSVSNLFTSPDSSPGMNEFKRSVARYALYKALIRTFPYAQVPLEVKSVVSPWVKKASKGIEVFYPDSSAKPLSMPVRKLEAPAQVTGEAVYPSDEDVGNHGFHGSIVYSTQCNAQLQSINASMAMKGEGVVAFYSAKDIPGDNTGGSDLYLFVPVGEMVECVGQAIGVIIAKTQQQADQAAALVQVAYSPQYSPPITTLKQAIEEKSFFPTPEVIPAVTLLKVGDADEALKGSYKVLSGRIDAGSQSHFYMEAQTAIARPMDGQFIEVICGTQAPSGYQESIASVLGVQQSNIVVKCPRVGGGFGGKLSRGTIVAAAASLAATKLSVPCKIFNNRNSDLAQTGGREGFYFDYQVGITEDGRMTGLIFDIYVDCGYSKSDAMGGLAMGMTWVDNAYYFPTYKATARLCKTNTQSRTSMRAPGVMQTCFATEVVINRIANDLQVPVTTIQAMNFIQNGQTNVLGQQINDSTLDQVWNILLQRSQYSARLSNIDTFNESNLYRKKGISICPVKYGMAWAGYNAGIRMSVNQSDGTIMISHTGCEIGQGINTKCCQAVLSALGLSDVSKIRVTSTSSSAIANGGVTGGSGTSEVVCQAALNACSTFKSRVAPFCSGGVYNISSMDQWMEMLGDVTADISLNVEGWYSPKGNPDGSPWQYFVYGAAVTEVELDVMSGDLHVISAEIVYDCGISMNPSIDIGQIEGGFVMGLGYFLTESVKHESDGTLFSNGTWEYKPPLAEEIPTVFNVTLLKDAPNDAGILRSKATGEPPMVLTNSVYFATKMAISSARKDVQGKNIDFDLVVPATVEHRQLACLPNAAHRFVMPSVSALAAVNRYYR